jgi:hypothetical protein
MKYFKILLLFTAAAVVASCSKNPVANVSHPLSNEFLTTTILNLHNTSNPNDKPTISYYLNPNNPNNPPVLTPDTLQLSKNSTYTCDILILDQTKNPPDTVSGVIKQRENIHLFVFYPSTGLGLKDSITDHDTNIPPLPFGMQSIITTTSASKGTLEVVLRHQPNVKNGSPTPGSTDMDATYPIKIK